MPPPLCASFLRPFAEQLQAKGASATRLLGSLGIPLELPSAHPVSHAAVRTFLDQAAALAHDDDFGLSTALTRPRGSYGLVEFATRSAPDLGRAFDFTIRCGPLLREGLVAYVEGAPELLRYGFSSPGEPLGLGPHGHAFKLISGLLIVREMTGEPCIPARTWFSHPAPSPKSLARLRQVLGSEVVAFDQPGCGVELPGSLNTAPLVGADVSLFRFLEHQALSRLSTHRSDDATAGLAEVIRAQLGRGAPSVSATAQALGLSVRTLQRRLSDDGSSFAAVVDSVRRDLACRGLTHSELPPAEVGRSLGYANEKAFFRAFRRWTGLTPREYRQRGRRSPAGDA